MPPLKVKKQIRLLVVLPYNVNYGFHIIIISSYWPGISQIYICLILGSKNNDWTLVVIPLMHDVLACLLTMLFVALTISNDNGPSNTSNVCSNTSDDLSDTTLELTDVQKKSTFSGIGQINSLVISSSLRWNSNSKNEIQKVWTNWRFSAGKVSTGGEYGRLRRRRGFQVGCGRRGSEYPLII